MKTYIKSTLIPEPKTFKHYAGKHTEIHNNQVDEKLLQTLS